MPCLYSLFTALPPAAKTQTLGRSSALVVSSLELPLHKHMESTHCLNDAAKISASSPNLSGSGPNLLFRLLLTFSPWWSHTTSTSEVLKGTPYLLVPLPALMIACWTRLRLQVSAHDPSAAQLPTKSCCPLSPDVLSPPASPPSHTVSYPAAIPIPAPPTNSSLHPLHARLSRIILLLQNCNSST